MEPAHLNPERLPLGTQVGGWRVVERRGRGAYGAVYRAVATAPDMRTVALKLALHPGDERFAREVELLSRLRHPSIPRLLDHGTWTSSSRLVYPYLAMELVEGVPLYDWARESLPTSRQVLELLSSLARALEATHAVGGVHRDVKGDNVLVSRLDGQVFLTDFGSAHYVGAATLTGGAFPPGTPEYRSPEAWRSVRPPIQASAVPYAPGPLDDIFALGVTAYRLVTGEYPLEPHPTSEAAHPWHGADASLRPPRALNARCCVELNALVTRMLSVRPEARGSAHELAEALERATRNAGPGADVSLFKREDAQPPIKTASPQRTVPRPVERSWPWLGAASLSAAMALGGGWLLSALPGDDPSLERNSTHEESKDGGTVAVGDSALTAPVAPTRPPFAWSTISVNLPPKPLPGQTRPDATGRCPRRSEVPINGGCWKKLAVDLKDCDEGDYVYKGACYSPAYPPARPATSGPAQRSDDNAP